MSFSPAERIKSLRAKYPAAGFLAEKSWRLAPSPFTLDKKLAEELSSLGRVLLQFNRAVNLLYRQSVAGKMPGWVAEWLDLGKEPELIELQRSNAFKNDLPRVIRPDILLTEDGFTIVELDSVPGAIGFTAWCNENYSAFGDKVIGGAEDMLRGFAGIFGSAPKVRIIVSSESSGYLPEMEWLAARLGADRFSVHNAAFEGVADGEAVYRFFELFDLKNVAVARSLFSRAAEKKITLTPPPKPIFEEKMLFALLWNRHLKDFWRKELGEGFFRVLQKHVPYSWLVDPAPLPAHAVLPELGIGSWQELKDFSQRERELILKISGYSENAWGSRGVYLGSDLSHGEWAEAVDLAIESFNRSPFVLQRYQKPKLYESLWVDERNEMHPMQGRVRLCPYYFVSGENEKMQANLSGVLATICPPDKKIIHGMQDAILTSCMTVEEPEKAS